MALISLTDRVKPFQTILNFRDFGAYKTDTKRGVVQGKLFRSAHLNNLSDAELSDISDLNIGLVVDLRYRPERERQPSRYPLADEAVVLTYPDQDVTEGPKVAPHEAFMEHELNSAQDAYDYMMRSYTARADDAGFQSVFRDTLLYMAETGNPLLIHCAAGKDRTGTLVALIQGILGVGDSDIENDYLLTNQAVDIESFLKPAAQMFTKRYGRDISPDALRPMFGVEADYLKAASMTMGDYKNYAIKKLGLSETELRHIHEHYLN
jgi:protein-tyrosine phosphatase